MPIEHRQTTDSYQAQFHQCWNHLNDPHVRALAWLLDSPDLLDLHASQWRGKIATLSGHGHTALHEWLTALDRAPALLQAAIEEKPNYRLGYYAEKLMAFYFQHQGMLLGHSVQIQSLMNDTVGEFDFLLRDRDEVMHWEFATKFYLHADMDEDASLNHFVGPNLADTLNAKMHKILEQQLLLGQHPASQARLPQAITSAQALVKGWLFYRGANAVQIDGISAAHCRGFWCTASEWQLSEDKHAIVLPRLQWLAPTKVPFALTADSISIKQTIRQHFEHDSVPLMVAVLEQNGEDAIEVDRGFIVPDDWPENARQYLNRVSKRL